MSDCVCACVCANCDDSLVGVSVCERECACVFLCERECLGGLGEVPKEMELPLVLI